MFYEKTVGEGDSAWHARIPDNAEELFISNGEQLLRVDFDLLLEDEHKLTLADALTTLDFKTPEMLLSELGLISKDELSDESIAHFTTDDAEIFELLTISGIPKEYAIRSVFYSSNGLGETPPLEVRHDHVSEFFLRDFSIHRENSGALKGFTTLDIYLLMIANAGTVVANYVTDVSASRPVEMQEYLSTLADFELSQAQKSSITREQISAIRYSSSSIFPTTKWDPQRRLILSLMRDFLLDEKINWSVAGHMVKSKNESLIALAKYLDGLFPGGGQGFSTSRMKHLEMLASLALARYSEDTLVLARETFESWRELFKRDSPYLFAAFYTLAQYFSVEDELITSRSSQLTLSERFSSETTKGKFEDKHQLDWIFALNPLINQEELFQR